MVKSLVLKPEPGFSLTRLAKSDNSALTSLSQGEVVALQFLTPLAVPAVLCFVLMIFQIYHLTRQKDVALSNQPGHEANQVTGSQNKVSSVDQGTETKKLNHNHRAAVTILIVTTAYVLTSIFSVAIWLVVYRTHLRGQEKIKKLSWAELSMIYISSSTSHLLCSSVTALTLLLRSAKLQLFLKKTYGEFISTLSSLI